MKNYLLTVLLLFVVAMGQNAMAALSASVSLVSSTAIINQPMTANVAISNTGASAVNVISIVPTASATGAAPGLSKIPAAFSSYNIGPNASVVVAAANSTTTIPFNVIFFAPSTGVTGSGTGTYSVGATVYTSDGSVFAAGTAALATVNPVPLPAAERQ